MVPTLEYLAHNVVYEIAIKRNMRYKRYVLIDETIDQYDEVIKKKFPFISTHKLGIDKLVVLMK